MVAQNHRSRHSSDSHSSPNWPVQGHCSGRSQWYTPRSFWGSQMHLPPSRTQPFSNGSPWGFLHSKGTGKAPPTTPGKPWPGDAKAEGAGGRVAQLGTVPSEPCSDPGQRSCHGVDEAQVMKTGRGLFHPKPTLPGTARVYYRPTPHSPEGETEFRQPAQSYPSDLVWDETQEPDSPSGPL